VLAPCVVWAGVVGLPDEVGQFPRSGRPSRPPHEDVGEEDGVALAPGVVLGGVVGLFGWQPKSPPRSPPHDDDDGVEGGVD
jgi:hypothetical protein